MSGSANVSAANAHAQAAPIANTSSSKTPASSGGGGTNGTIANIGQLAKEYPEIYKMMIQSNFGQFMSKQQRYEDKRHEENKKIYQS